MTTEDAKKTSVDDLLNRLSASKKGLSSSEAEKRLKQFGPNEIPEKKVNPIIKFLGYFWGPIPWMIEAAVVISAVRGDIGHLRSYSSASFYEFYSGFLRGTSSERRY